jgi:hypothetical protein
MRYWIKLYTEIVHDPKMGRLTDRQFRTCINLFALAGELDQDGALPGLADMAWELHIPYDDLVTDLQALAAVNILTCDTDTWHICKWQKRQAQAPSAAPDKVLQRVHEHRERKRNEGVTSLRQEAKRDVTPPDTDTDTDVETETKTDKLQLPSLAWQGFINARGVNINPADSQYVQEMEDLYGTDAVAQAISYCDQHKKNNFLSLAYVQKMLTVWQGEGTLGLHENGQGGNGNGAAKNKSPAKRVITRKPSSAGTEWIYYYADDNTEVRREIRASDEMTW